MNESKPIIVIGMNRSGTKWLSNMLSNHSDIVSVQNIRGGGIIETNLFDNFPKAFGDLSYPDNYAGFIECWSKTDFFKTARTDKEILLRLKPGDYDYFNLFRFIMEDLAMRTGKKYWLQKTNPFNALACITHYNNGRFIVIKRNLVDNLKSNIQLRQNRKKGKQHVMKEVFFYKYQEKLLYQIMKHENVSLVSYDALKDDTEKIMKKVCGHLRIDFQPSMLKVGFSPNTSFKSTDQRKKVLSMAQVRMINSYSRIFNSLPLSFFKIARSILADKKHRFIPGTFGSIKDKYKME